MNQINVHPSHETDVIETGNLPSQPDVPASAGNTGGSGAASIRG